MGYRLSVIGLLTLLVLGTGCNNNTYSNLREQENKMVQNYIQRKGLEITEVEPDASLTSWPEKLYYHKSISGYGDYYFHLISRGDSIRIDSVGATQLDTVDLEIVANDIIIARYKQFGLTENPDTISYWTTLDQAYPFQFHYGNMSECEAASWHSAVQLMKYPDSQCEMIVPSKTGFSNEQQTVTPYVYILKIKVKQ